MVQGMGLDGNNNNNRRSKEDIERSKRNRQRLRQSMQKTPTKSNLKRGSVNRDSPYKKMIIAGVSGFLIVVVILLGFRYMSGRKVKDAGMIEFPEQSEEVVDSDLDVEITLEFEEALLIAVDHVENNPYSKAGLKDQMIEEAFELPAIEYALDNVDADWTQQAVLAGERYVEYTSPDATIKGLREQLGYEKFTAKEINYVVDQLAIE